jgi:type VI secretion system protein ImpG
MEQRLHEAFLAELEALEKFRVSYSGMYPQVPLASEDPDVRRLLEALAMFTARTRVSSERNLEASLLRIFRQHFPYLLSPIPAMVMLRGEVSRRYVDVSVLPRGAEIGLLQRGEGDAPDHVYRFRTLSALRLLPIELEGVETFVRKGRGTRIALRFAAGFLRNDEVDEVELRIDYLNDLHSSLLVLHALQANLVAASVSWNHDVSEDSAAEPCQAEFGARAPEPAELEPFDHPLQQVRAALHFPQSALFLRVKGLKAPRNWQRFTVLFDLGEGWPANLRLNTDCFVLHVVPLINIVRETADPLTHDGTLDRQLALHPDRALGMVPVAVHAVYRRTDTGLLPLEPAMLRSGRESFEAELEGAGGARRAWISLHLPDAFDHPETVVVDALWHQPGVSERRASDLQVQLQARFIEGVRWSCLGALCPHADSELDSDRQGMLELLSIKGQRLLGLDELRFLLHAFGVSRERGFARLATRMAELRIVEKPLVRRANGFKHVYELGFRELMPSDLPRLNLLCSQLMRLLAAWAADEVVELVAKVPNLEKEFRYA